MRDETLASARPADRTLKKTVRRAKREQRRQLSPSAQRLASNRLLKQLQHLPWFSSAKRIGLYLAADGEIDPEPLTQLASLRFSRFFVPVLLPVRRPRRLQFAALRSAHYQPVRMQRNRLNIAEPMRNEQRRVWPSELDVLLMPLVAFDRQGNRLGMGGGFYDRTLMVRASHQQIARPKLVGLAHHFQEVDTLPADSWDVPLQAIVTDRDCQVF